MSSPPNRPSKSSNPVPPRQANKATGAKVPPSNIEPISNDLGSDDSAASDPAASVSQTNKEPEASTHEMSSKTTSSSAEASAPAHHPVNSGSAAQVTSNETPLAGSDLDEQAFNLRQQPIPPPSESRQYRAIGLIRGRYNPSAEQFTRGMLVASDGTEIDAVLLGRVMSLVKKHINLEEEHLWVVYPRTREREFQLHAQIVGVWEPEKLHRQSSADEAHDTSAQHSPLLPLEDGYFSIRGEVVFQAEESGHVTVKIRQTPKKQEEGEKSFKLQLKGMLAGKAVGYFWDLTVQRQETSLVIQSGNSIGIMPPRKKPARSKSGPYRKSGPGGPQRNRPGQRPGSGGSTGSRPQGASAPPPPPVRKEPLPKPVKRKSTNNPG